MICEEGRDERLALNRVGSFERNLARRTLELDAAGQAVFDLRPGEHDGDPESLRPASPARRACASTPYGADLHGPYRQGPSGRRVSV
ncbi:hypothetical protein SSPS47_02285 [Streptomyces sp. S4.7]|nr:hypothetical protein SSPS47_02285 [Streptomyces sp. S4.7]